MTPIEKLTRLADLLEADPDTWPPAPTAKRPGFHLDWFYTPMSGHPCGAVCCAIGLACLDPVLRSQGLELRGLVVFLNDPEDGWLAGFAAAERFFGLDALPGFDGEDRHYEVVDWLFQPSAYPPEQRTDPKAVAARVREVIADLRRQAEPAAAGV